MIFNELGQFLGKTYESRYFVTIHAPPVFIPMWYDAHVQRKQATQLVNLQMMSLRLNLRQ